MPDKPLQAPRKNARPSGVVIWLSKATDNAWPRLAISFTNEFFNGIGHSLRFNQ